MSKRALITGASGQDSLLLSKYLMQEHGYQVWALARRAARPQSRHVTRLQKEFGDQYTLLNGDITDMASIIEAIDAAKPDEFYNLAAQSHVGLSFKEPLSTIQITGLGAINCMEAIRMTSPETRFYQASSSEMFGGTKSGDYATATFMDGDMLDAGFDGDVIVINENTPFNPRSPYACAKTLAHNYAQNMREAYNLHFSCGILFNHESELRKIDFVTRKVTSYVALLWYLNEGTKTNIDIKKLGLGTTNFARDWGCAKDYVRAMHLMLQQDEPDDYVIATGTCKTGKDLLKTAFKYLGEDWEEHVVLDPEFERPTDVKVLVGDCTKAREKLGWTHEREFEKLIYDMIENDIRVLADNLEITE
jgi:GDPmannose 4,6-dehydratase